MQLTRVPVTGTSFSLFVFWRVPRMDLIEFLTCCMSTFNNIAKFPPGDGATFGFYAGSRDDHVNGKREKLAGLT